MSESAGLDVVDLGEYCRRVEEHLTRVNQGHIVRIVGPAFELVRSWALEGVPLGIVTQGIDSKAERHRAGRSTRPLRLEFCEADVREVYARWRRAVGLAAASAVTGAMAGTSTDAPAESEKRPSLSRQIDRALDKLARASGRLDLPDTFRDEVGRAIGALSAIRERARTARREARTALAAELGPIDDALVAAGRAAVSAETLDRLRANAEHDLATYRGRLAADVWRRSVNRALDQLVRDHLGLPTLSLDA